MEFVFKISSFLETHWLFCSKIRKLLPPGQCGDDEEGIDRLVAASSTYPLEQPREVRRSAATRKCIALATVRWSRPIKTTGFRRPWALSRFLGLLNPVVLMDSPSNYYVSCTCIGFLCSISCHAMYRIRGRMWSGRRGNGLWISLTAVHKCSSRT